MDDSDKNRFYLRYIVKGGAVEKDNPEVLMF